MQLRFPTGDHRCNANACIPSSSKPTFREILLHTIPTENKKTRRIYKTGLELIQKFTTSKVKERSIRIGWLSNDENVIRNSKKKKKKNRNEECGSPFWADVSSKKMHTR